MAAKKSAALEFTREYLRRKPDAAFSEIRDAAAEQDLLIYPIVFGRAKALEGLVQVAPYGSKKRAKERKQRTLEQASDPSGQGSTLSASLEAVVARLRQQGNDHERYRKALIEIARILDEVLD